MRSRWPAGLLVFVLAAGCTTEVSGSPATGPSGPSPTATSGSSTGPVDLAEPIELRPVPVPGATATTTLPGPDGEQLPLAEPFMTIRRLDSAEVVFEQAAGAWVLELELTDPDATSFGDWTTGHTNERLAMVVAGEVLTAPTIQSPITDGAVQITGNFSQNDARDLLDRLTGR